MISGLHLLSLLSTHPLTHSPSYPLTHPRTEDRSRFFLLAGEFPVERRQAHPEQQGSLFLVASAILHGSIEIGLFLAVQIVFERNERFVGGRFGARRAVCIPGAVQGVEG